MAQWKAGEDETGSKLGLFVGFRLELCRPSGRERKCISVHVCTCARVRELVFSPLSDGEMQREVVDDKRKSALAVIQSRGERLIGDKGKVLWD